MFILWNSKWKKFLIFVIGNKYKEKYIITCLMSHIRQLLAYAPEVMEEAIILLKD